MRVKKAWFLATPKPGMQALPLPAAAKNSTCLDVVDLLDTSISKERTWKSPMNTSRVEKKLGERLSASDIWDIAQSELFDVKGQCRIRPTPEGILGLDADKDTVWGILRTLSEPLSKGRNIKSLPAPAEQLAGASRKRRIDWTAVTDNAYKSGKRKIDVPDNGYVNGKSPTGACSKIYDGEDCPILGNKEIKQPPKEVLSRKIPSAADGSDAIINYSSRLLACLPKSLAGEDSGTAAAVRMVVTASSSPDCKTPARDKRARSNGYISPAKSKCERIGSGKSSQKPHCMLPPVVEVMLPNCQVVISRRGIGLWQQEQERIIMDEILKADAKENKKALRLLEDIDLSGV